MDCLSFRIRAEPVSTFVFPMLFLTGYPESIKTPCYPTREKTYQGNERAERGAAVALRSKTRLSGWWLAN